jgi:hypothetical protein
MDGLLGKSVSVGAQVIGASGKNAAYEDPISDESFDALLGLLGEMALRRKAARRRNAATGLPVTGGPEPFRTDGLPRVVGDGPDTPTFR